MNLTSVHSILEHFPAGFRVTAIRSLGAAGGLSGAQFWQIDTGNRRLALRRWPVESPNALRLQWIHSVIQHAATQIDFLPVPIATRRGQTFVESAGHLWELAPWMPGIADFATAPSRERLQAAMSALARFHNAARDASGPPGTKPISEPGVRRRIARLNSLVAGELDGLKNAVDDRLWPELAVQAREFLSLVPPAIAPVLAQLSAVVCADLPLQPCIRDVWHDHILFEGDTVTGLIDFGAMDFDTPATDIARLLGSLIGETTQTLAPQPSDFENRRAAWLVGLEAYEAVRALASLEREAAFAIDSANPIIAGCNWIRWVFLDRRQFADRGQILSRFKRLVQQLAHDRQSRPVSHY